MAAAEVSRDQVLPHDAVFASMCIKHGDSGLGGPVQHPSHPHPHPGLTDTDGESPSIPMGCYGWSTGQGGVSKDAAGGQSTEMTEGWLPGAFCSADEPGSGCCTDGTSSKLTPASAAVLHWCCGCTEVSVLEGLWVRMQVGLQGREYVPERRQLPAPCEAAHTEEC